MPTLLRAPEVYAIVTDALKRGGGNGTRKVIDALYDDAVRNSKKYDDNFDRRFAEAIDGFGIAWGMRRKKGASSLKEKTDESDSISGYRMIGNAMYPVPCTMRGNKWEYEAHCFNYSTKSAASRFLSAMEVEGWEIMNITGTGLDDVIWFKRQRKSNDKRRLQSSGWRQKKA